MNNGLTLRDINTIRTILRKYPEITRVYIFGSRAKGNYHPGSDIDLAIMNMGVNDETIRRIKAEFEESKLPYFVDLVNYHELKHFDLKDHIDRVGKEFYIKEDSF